MTLQGKGIEVDLTQEGVVVRKLQARESKRQNDSPISNYSTPVRSPFPTIDTLHRRKGGGWIRMAALVLASEASTT